MMSRCGRVDVRGGSPGTRETDLLDLTKEVRAVNAGTPQEAPDIVDFNQWPSFSKAVLVALMFIGACAGSTGGGIKVSRIMILLKAARSYMRKMLHPNAVATVRLEGKPLPESVVNGTYLYFTVYMMVFLASFLLLSLDGFDLITTVTAVVACFNNIGPGLELVGPMGNFSQFSPLGKLLLAFDMLAGRLELFPMLLLFAPSIWKRRLVRSNHI